MTQATMYGLGKTETRMCYDGKEHECKVLDCSVILKGNTYANKSAIKSDGFSWMDLSDDRYWHKHVSNAEEITAIKEKYEALGVRVTVRPNFRIVD